MNDLKVFQNSDFGELSIMMIDGKEYFPGAQCARILGYSNPQKAIRDHCDEDGCTKRSVIDNLGRTQEMKFIDEGNLYRLIIRSKLPAAKKFEHWVFDEVLPEIRRSGGYGVINLEEIITKAVTAAVSETVKALMPLITAPQVQSTPPKRVAIVCKPKIKTKIDMLPPKVKEQVDDMLCSGEYTSKEISNYIQNKTGLYISYVTLCNYKKENFLLVDEESNMQLSLFQEV